MPDMEASGLKPIRVAFLGLAHLHTYSYKLLFGYLPAVQVVAAAEADETLLDAFTRVFDLRGYSDWRTLLDREAIDLAVLFLPHADCPEAAVACADRGIHILAEKPMAADSAGIRLMIDAARRSGVVFSTPYVWRFHPVSIALRDLVRAGALGKIFGGQGLCAAGGAHRYVQGGAGWMLRKARSGGGAMHNLGVHWIDLFRWLLEDEVVEVTGRSIHFGVEHDVEDAALAFIAFAGGAVLTLDVSYSVPDAFPGGREMYIALRGRKGLASWRPSLKEQQQSLFVCRDAQGQQADCQEMEHLYPLQPGYAGWCGRSFLADFVNAIRQGCAPAITGTDGLRALEVVEAIYRSAESGTAIRLDSDNHRVGARPDGVRQPPARKISPTLDRSQS
jgi:predicted dehydrogenase